MAHPRAFALLAFVLAGQAAGLLLELGPQEDAKLQSQRERRDAQQHRMWLKRTKKEGKAAIKDKEKKEAGDTKTQVGVGARLTNLWEKLTYDAEEHTTPQPLVYNEMNQPIPGVPLWYQGHIPYDLYYMNKRSRADFFARMERWHGNEELRKTCEYPKPDEKVLYLSTHGDVLMDGMKERTDDAGTWELGMQQAWNFRRDPMMKRAFSDNPRQRVNLVITAPARKCMETAVNAYADLLDNATFLVDRDLKGFAVEGALKLGAGHYFLDDCITGGTKGGIRACKSLKEQYNAFPPHWTNMHDDHTDRFTNLVEDLLERQERNIAIIGHHMMLKQFNVELATAECVIVALAPNSTWRTLSAPDCWPAEY